MSFLRVTEAGLWSTVQDLGRFGSQALAVPVCGARDADALRLANVVVGNDEGCAGLEMVISGAAFEVVAESVRVAVAGADCLLEIESAKEKKRRRIPPLESVRLCRGSRLRVVFGAGCFCALLAVERGFAVEKILGSRSTCVAGKFGGFNGRPLQPGDELPLAAARVEKRPESLLTESLEKEVDSIIRVVPGPQEENFTEAARQLFYRSRYTISPRSDRIGIRLHGAALAHSALGFNLISDGIVTGAVQVPGNGLPIILFYDHQTTGGYPKIATVISTDLPRLGRLAPGETIQFSAVTVARAEALRRLHEANFQRLCRSIVPVTSEEEALSARLRAASLIS